MSGPPCAPSPRSLNGDEDCRAGSDPTVVKGPLGEAKSCIAFKRSQKGVEVASINIGRVTLELVRLESGSVYQEATRSDKLLLVLEGVCTVRLKAARWVLKRFEYLIIPSKAKFEVVNLEDSDCIFLALSSQ